MGRVSRLSLHERGQIKVLSTTGYRVKQIADVKSNGRSSKLNDCENREILRTTSNSTTSIDGICKTCDIYASKTTVLRMLDKYPNIVQSQKKTYPELTQVQLSRVFKNKPIN
uniref:HTH_38 domain-containing protein n=1 Tax=Heterorhabditis bacteriophora TaxID=37862 RepID=A0A1I7XE91_HETBA